MNVSPERRRELDLESAVCDAASMASITVEFIGRALHFDDRKVPQLSYEECEMLSFAVLQTRMFCDRVKTIFYRE